MFTIVHESSGQPHAFRAVLFDMDGVLTDNQRFHHAAWTECLRERYGIELVHGDQRIQAGLNHEILERVTGRAPSPEEARAFHDFKEDRYRHLARGALGPVQGLHAYLAWLSARDIPVALVTGGDRQCVAFVLDQLGLDGRFPVAVTGDDVGRGKPAPDPYLLAAEQLRIDPADCLVHEDSEGGIVSAVTAGAVVSAVATSLPEPALRAAGAAWAAPHFDAWLTHLEQRAGASAFEPARGAL